MDSTENIDHKKLSKEAAKKKAKEEKLEKLRLKNEKFDKLKALTKDKDYKKKKEKKEKKIIYDKPTAIGDKKDISGPFPAEYEPSKYVEYKMLWYEWWKKSGFFKPEINAPNGDLSRYNGKDKFIMVIPPPNVTGSLHLGHALTIAIEDTLTRWNRMKGRLTLWVPGCDHAGIATQVVVEKKLKKERNLSRYDLGREKFIEEIWKWKNEKGDRIYKQLSLLGSSVDWDRATFTMDQKMSKSVVEAFVRLHEEGCIYRGKRLVNWSCELRSAISDIEVDKLELQGREFLSVPGYSEKIEFGVLYSFAYSVYNEDDKIIVCTTRIETMLGDTAVAVHPNDQRYMHLHGKFVKHPFLEKILPIICDDFVEIDFGTGAVKITPAHDYIDYEVGKRHNLPFVNIFDDEGNILPGFGDFSGLKRFHARTAVIKALQDKGLYINSTSNPMIVPICNRSKDILEPILKFQWFVNCNDMSKKAIDAVKKGHLEIIPKEKVKDWFKWLDNIRDWCISRQLWWGHRIPAYKATILEENYKKFSEEESWFSGRNEEEARIKASHYFNVDPKMIHLEQDEDVLDTWFSSGLFPFAVFGWPEETEDLKYFYPGTFLETGHDILFFWVARMVMLGTHLLGKIPFQKVYLHSIVRDAHGRKMSKSLGNVIDPIDVIKGISLDDLHKMLLDSNLDPKEIEKAKKGQRADFPDGIPECGTDALRFTLLAYTSSGRDINLDIKRVEGYRAFCNKLWNAFKFTLINLGENFSPKISNYNMNNMDRWILSRCSFAVELCNASLEVLDFQKLTTICYNFWYYEICDVYLESLKPIMQQSHENIKNISRQTLYTVVDIGLRLLHPIMPFITEELYQRLPRRHDTDPQSICITSYPEIDHLWWKRDLEIEKEVSFVNKIIHNVRSIRADYNLAKSKVPLYINYISDVSNQELEPYIQTIQILTCSSNVELLNGKNPPKGCAFAPITSSCEVYLLLKGTIDANKELNRLKMKKEKIEGPLNKLKALIDEKDYQIKVPSDVQTKNLQELTRLQAEFSKINIEIETMEKLDAN